MSKRIEARPGTFVLFLYLTLAAIGGLGILGKVGLFHVLGARYQPLILVALCAWILSSLFYKIAIRLRIYIAPLVIVGLILCPLVVLPRAEKLHAVGRGTDQPACIVAASDSMVHNQWPYDRSRMWSRNPMSCGPGWVAIQAPLVQAVGYRWTLVLEIAISIFMLIYLCGWKRSSGLLSLLALAPGFWITACDGSDFLPFGLLVMIFSLLRAKSRWVSLALAIALGLITQFRTATVLLPAALSRRLGRTGLMVASSIAIGVQASFLFHDPVKFTREGPMHLFAKLTGAEFPFATPLNLTIAYVLIATVGTLCMWLLSRRYSSDSLLLAYLLCIFAAPALLNLVSTLVHFGIHFSSLGVWEGGNWIIGVLPLSALLLVAQEQPFESNTVDRIQDDAWVHSQPTRLTQRWSSPR